jgi:hypothetical protein
MRMPPGLEGGNATYRNSTPILTAPEIRVDRALRLRSDGDLRSREQNIRVGAEWASRATEAARQLKVGRTTNAENSRSLRPN